MSQQENMHVHYRRGGVWSIYSIELNNSTLELVMEIGSLILVDGSWYCVEEICLVDSVICASDDDGACFEFGIDEVEQIR